MNYQKTKWIGLTLLLIPFLLTGCQPKCPKPEENIPGTSGYRNDCPFADPSSVTSGGPIELDFYFVFDDTEDFQEQIQAFQSQNPGVIVRPKKFVNLQEYEDLIINEIAEGEGPDLFMVHNSWMLKHWKKLLPLPADQPVVMTPELFRQTFFQAAIDDLIIDEEIYGMPLSIDNLAVYYNKSYFRDLLATTDQPGPLWEDIKNQVFGLTKPNKSPERFALAGIGIGRADNVFRAVDTLYALMLQYGVNFYDDRGENATFANASSLSGSGIRNPGEEALSLYSSFGLPSFKNYSWNDTITGFEPDQKEINPFIRGKAGMIMGYPYLYDELVLAIQNQQRSGGDHIAVEDIAIAPFPQLVTATESTRRDTLASYFPLVVARTSDHPRQAWSLAQYLTSADALQTYYRKTKRPTSRKDLVQEQQTDPLFGVFAFQAPFAKSFKIFDAASYDKIFRDAIQQVVTNVATPKQAMQEAQKKVTCIIKKQRKLISTEQDCGI